MKIVIWPPNNLLAHIDELRVARNPKRWTSDWGTGDGTHMGEGCYHTLMCTDLGVGAYNGADGNGGSKPHVGWTLNQ
jgi:hypothetical protein